MLSGWNDVDRRTKARWLVDLIAGYFRGDFDGPIVYGAGKAILWWGSLCIAPALVAIAVFGWDGRTESQVVTVWRTVFSVGLLVAAPAGVILRLRVADESTRGPTAVILRSVTALWVMLVCELVLVISWSANVAAVEFAASFVT